MSREIIQEQGKAREDFEGLIAAFQWVAEGVEVPQVYNHFAVMTFLASSPLGLLLQKGSSCACIIVGPARQVGVLPVRTISCPCPSLNRGHSSISRLAHMRYLLSKAGLPGFTFPEILAGCVI